MSFIAALALFIAVVGAITAVRRAGTTPQISAFDDQPKRLPQPGSRDRFALCAPTLGRAPVPSWG